MERFCAGPARIRKQMVGPACQGLAASDSIMLCSDLLGIGMRSKREKAMTADLRVARRIDALFKALSTDFLLREQFVTDPAQIMAEYVTGSSLPEDAADVSNQMLYAVVSNGSFLRWMVRYARQHDGQPLTRGHSRGTSQTPCQHMATDKWWER